MPSYGQLEQEVISLRDEVAFYKQELEQALRSVATVAAKEREACADFLEHGVFDDDGHHKQYAKAIRARGGIE